jgi:hypothetical protein
MNYKDRLIKNEQIIRDKNMASSIGIRKFYRNKKEVTEAPLEFLCECSDLDCPAHVVMSIREYERLHKQQNRFVIAKGHKSPSVEKTVERIGTLEIVEKPTLLP